MSIEDKAATHQQEQPPSRRNLLYMVLGGVIAALTGWVAGAFPKDEMVEPEPASASPSELRIAALEATVAKLTDELMKAGVVQPLGHLEGEMNERVVFPKSELSLINPAGVLLNLVATAGHVGIRFYKDFGFGQEKVTNPWHMGFIEGNPGYQGLAILRDWRFTAALWDEDGKLTVGRLDPHPPANLPARARFEVRGTLDEVQTVVEGAAGQTADIFQVASADGTRHLSVNSEGSAVVGSPDAPKSVILYDKVDRSAYSLEIAKGSLTLTKI